MGHYASEMAGPYSGPSNEEKLAEKLARLKSDWDWAKELLDTGHVPFDDGDNYTCPDCFAQVNYWFLKAHDTWHKTLPIRNMFGMLL